MAHINQKIARSLVDCYPELAEQWNYEKNGDLKPDEVAAHSNEKVWWLLPYDDPETGQHFDFAWQATISDRVYGTGCPFLSGKKVFKGFNDLETKYPELAKQWHPTKNMNLTPDMFTVHSGKKVWWLQLHKDLKTGKQFAFEWEDSINNRTNGMGCPYLTGKRVWKGYNDLQTIFPELAKQWHPTKNGNLTPDMVTAHSGKKVWWFYPYDEPETRKHFDFEWESSIGNRVKDGGCPFLSGRKVWKGYNDLVTKRPDIAQQWHPTKNGNITPDMVLFSSNKKAWWLILYTNPTTGECVDIEWCSEISTRTLRSDGRIPEKRVWPGYNDLATIYPDLAKQWNYDKNGDLTPNMVTAHCALMVWWKMPYDDPETGIHYNFEWSATVNSRTRKGAEGCPYLAGKLVYKGFNDFETKYPELAKQWNYEKNGDLRPDQITPYYRKPVWWKIVYDDPETKIHHVFEWEAKTSSRIKSPGCPFLSGHAVKAGYNDLMSCFPDIAKDWDYSKNKISPDAIYKYSRSKVWWKCHKCGHEWRAAINNRTNIGRKCPNCSDE